MARLLGVFCRLSFFVPLWLLLGCPEPETEKPDARYNVKYDAKRSDTIGSDTIGRDTIGSDASGVDALGTDASAVDSGPGFDRRVGSADANDPNNNSKDSDCDGLSDAEEFGNVYAGGGHTDPDNPDSDGDGIDDGIEVGRTQSPDVRCTHFVADADPTSTTDPTNNDSDGDGLLDGQEDANQDGARDPINELDPRNPDSDRDGRCDGPNDVTPICTGGDPDPFSSVLDEDHDGVPDSEDADPTNPDRDGDGLCDGPRDVAGTCVGGEDLNGDGIVAANETDPGHPDTDCDGLSDLDEIAAGTNPRKADTDGDLIPDGVEMGRDQNLEPGYCTFDGDADTATTTDPNAMDSDGDGINDGVEDSNRNGRVDTGETNPDNPDTDGDGICDGPPTTIAGVCTGGEDINANGVVDPGETDPTVVGSDDPDSDSDGIPDSIENSVTCLDVANADSDGDGIDDGVEDSNHNGRVDVGETDPCDIDSDCDGLVDGTSFGVYTGEASVQPTATSATNADSDGDGLSDGLEVGIGLASVPPGTDAACGFVVDGCPSNATNPAVADTDNDGVPDGAEDTNQDGCVDAGELDPNDNGDVTGPVTEACSSSNLVPVDVQAQWLPDLQMANAVRTPNVFGELVNIEESGGGIVGIMGYNPDTKVAYIALTKQPAGADAAAEETDGRGRLTQAGTIGLPITTQITTWDGYPAVRATYDQASTTAVKAQANAIVARYFPNTGTLLDTAGDVSPTGGYKLRAEYIRRSSNTAVVLIAIVPANHYTGDAVFSLYDTGNGSALAQFGDTVGVQCDLFESTGYADVDFLFAVDNSGSMDNDQAAVAATGTEMDSILSNSTMNWRVALVASDYDRHDNDSPHCANASPSASGSRCRYFTSNISEFTDWFDSSSSSWVSDNGSGTERTMYNAQHFVQDFLLPTSTQVPAPNDKIRRGAYLVVIFLTDAEDQYSSYSSEAGRQANIANYTAFFTDFDPNVSGDQTALLGGMLCAPGQSSGCDGREPYADYPVIHGVINNLGGVIGDLKDTATIAPTILQILTDVAGATSPYSLSKAAISSTIKVSMAHNSTIGTCNWDDVPRDRQNGFDYDPVSGTVVFYGDCRPDPGQPGSQVVVSYRYWTDRTPDPDGPTTGCDCTPPEVCDPVTEECYCPPDCGVGTVPPEQVCDTGTCELVCRADCGTSCPNNSVCNSSQAVCDCECPTDCGGQAPGGNFVCDRDPAHTTFCQYICNECPGTPSNQLMDCNLNSCNWECPDCGDCPGLASCSDTTCACECQQSLTCGAGYTWSDTACECVCDVDQLGCNSLHMADPDLCACICRDNCGDQCDSGTYCNESFCFCYPMGG